MTVSALSEAVQLAIGQAGVVIDDAEHERGAGLAGAVALGTLSGGPVARTIELRQPQRVEMQQRAGLGPLITP